MMRFLRRSYAMLILGFLYLPILILIVFSFNASKSRATWGGFTLRWYGELIESEAILDALAQLLARDRDLRAHAVTSAPRGPGASAPGESGPC